MLLWISGVMCYIYRSILCKRLIILISNNNYYLIVDLMSVTIVCEDESFTVDLEIAKQSVILKNMIEDIGAQENLNINNIKKDTMRRVIEFCKHYKESKLPAIQKPLQSANLSEAINEEWYVKFIDLDKVDDIIEIVIAANFLDIDPLTELSCAKIASMIKGKSVEEIRKKFGIENDFTPEEEAQIREENKWAESVVNN